MHPEDELHKTFFSFMIPCNAKRKLNTVPQLPSFFSILDWSRATFHRQVEVCAFHHNLSLLSLLFYLGWGNTKVRFQFLLIFYKHLRGVHAAKKKQISAFDVAAEVRVSPGEVLWALVQRVDQSQGGYVGHTARRIRLVMGGCRSARKRRIAL